MSNHVYGVILAGGSGTRFWPLSRERFPKQLLRIIGEGTLLQQTFERLLQHIGAKHMTVVTNDVQAESIRLQLSKWKDDLVDNIILEPEGRNTAPAIALTALQLMHRDPEAVMVVVPADHVVTSAKKFTRAVQFATKLAEQGHLVTFGIQPSRPETGYGYIQPNKRRRLRAQGAFVGYSVARFVEKPDLPTAKRYCRSGNYFWNSGIFVWKAATILEEFALQQPILTKLLNSLQRQVGTPEFPAALRKAYAKMPSLSIDHAVMEHSARSVVVPVDFGWSDVGSWGSLEEVAPLDKAGNVRNGNIIDIGSQNSVLFADRRLVATIGLDNMVVVDTPDATLVSSKEKVQEVRKVVEALKKGRREEHLIHRTVERPWGSYTVLEKGNRYKIKRVVLNPKAKLSLQIHHHRSEHWVVVSGTARVTKGDEVFDVHPNESTFIPVSIKHRLENPGIIPLQIIEVQNGDYVEEDDIERLDDDYQRVKKE